MLLVACVGATAAPFQPSWDSLNTRAFPSWYNDAKIGFKIHWGPYSVPGYGDKLLVSTAQDGMVRGYQPPSTPVDEAVAAVPIPAILEFATPRQPAGLSALTSICTPSTQ